MRLSNGKAVMIGACAALALAVPSTGFAFVAFDSAPTQGAPACGVGGAVKGAFAALPANATLEDYEGAVAFAVSQAQCSHDDAIAELGQMLKDPTLTALQRQAIENVVAAPGDAGTGAIATTSSFSSSFGAPSVGVGGGVSNYTNT